MELSDYDADLMDILSPAELSPLPNEPPPPPYMSGRLPVNDLNFEENAVSSGSDKANAMQNKIRGVVARLAETRLHQAAQIGGDDSLPRPVRRTAPLGAAASASAAARELKEKERKQKMQDLRAATVQRVHSKHTANRESERRQQQSEAVKMEQLRKARKEELSRLKERREHQLKLASRDPEPKVSAARLELAIKHYRRHLLVNVGLSPWLLLSRRGRLNIEKADNFYADRLMQCYYGAWKSVLLSAKLDRRKRSQRMNTLAIAYYSRQLLRFVWKKWKLYRKLLKAKALTVGGEFSRFALRRRSFLSWKIAYDRRVRQLAAKMQTVAIPHSVGVLRRYYVARWRSFVRQAKFDRDVQLRTDLTWSKVQGWLVSDKK